MKAAVLFGPGDLRIADFPDPPMGEDSVKIKVEYCGICGTDFHKYAGKTGSRPVVYPVPLGHEISGVVADVGSKVADFGKGDRVTVDPNWSCGRCWYCRNGKRHLCSNSKGVVKGMAEYVCPPKENVYLVPDNLSLLDASLAEPLSCCLQGMDQLGVKLGETVAVVGFGAIGQIVTRLCRLSSAAEIVVFETVEEKRDLAFTLGATAFINPMKEDIKGRALSFGIECIEKVIECGGNPSSAQLAFSIAGKGATVVLFGVLDSNATLPFNSYEAFTKELTIKTSYINPNTMHRAIQLLGKGSLNTKELVAGIIPLEEVPNEIASRTISKKGKVVVKI